MNLKYAIILLIGVALAGVVALMLRIENAITVPGGISTVVVTAPSESIDHLGGLTPDDLQAAIAQARHWFRTGTTYFEIAGARADSTSWAPIFLKGVNLGVSLPGKFPTEFSMTFDQYYAWLDLISRMNANTVRLYTILPPAFYEAFAQFNLDHHSRRLFLLQGVWANEPADGRYTHSVYTAAFQEEIVRAIDILHGRADLPEKRGSAHGVYSRDISPFVAGIILGCEWEPYNVHKTNLHRPDSSYRGHFISTFRANAMEVWLAKMLDFAATYETWRYRSQTPLSFINWQAADPMFHSTEYVSHAGGFDFDGESLDYNKFHAAPSLRAGLFASYHAYPYFPDFVHREPKYQVFRDSSGRVDNFRSYLADLRAHQGGIPLLISEYGLSSSRGNSRANPFGFHQGGHCEHEHAQLSRTLTEDIHQTGCAGAIFFEWSDEWFKNNWLVQRYEMPQDRRIFWHNMENPEQNYGILAVEVPGKKLDGNLDDWTRPLTSTRAGIIADHDAAYFYLAAQLPGFDFAHHTLYVALDTYRPRIGAHRLPGLPAPVLQGIEFLLRFSGIDSAEILVDAPYQPSPPKTIPTGSLSRRDCR